MPNRARRSRPTHISLSPEDCFLLRWIAARLRELAELLDRLVSPR